MPCKINSSIVKNLFSYGLEKSSICLMLRFIMISDADGNCTVNYNDMLSDMKISQGTFYTDLKSLRDKEFISYSKTGYNISIHICDYKISENSYISLNNLFFNSEEYLNLKGIELCMYLYTLRFHYMNARTKYGNGIVTLEQAAMDTGYAATTIRNAMTSLVKKGYLEREWRRDIKSKNGRRVYAYKLVDKWNRTNRKRKINKEQKNEVQKTIKETHSFSPYYANIVRLLCRQYKCVIPDVKTLIDCGETSNLYYRACVKSGKNILDAIKSSVRKLAGKTIIGGVFNKIMKNYVNCQDNCNLLMT